MNGTPLQVCRVAMSTMDSDASDCSLLEPGAEIYWSESEHGSESEEEVVWVRLRSPLSV